MKRRTDNYLQEAGPSWWSFGRDHSILMIIYKSPLHPDDHLQEASPSWWSFERGWSILMIKLQGVGPSGWSFARCQYILMIICKMPVYPDDHLQNACPSRLIICKRLVHPYDHLQEAGPSWWLFARGQSILMIICKMPVHPHDHLQEAGSSWWSFARGRSTLMILNDVLNLLSPVGCTNHNGVFVRVIRMEKTRQIWANCGKRLIIKDTMNCKEQ